MSEDCLEATSDGNLAFNTNGNAQWQGSTAQAWCKDLAGVSGAGTDIPDAFSPIELAALLPTTKTDGAYSDSYMPSYSFAAGDILQGDKLFFLSAEEAGARVYGFENLSNRIAKSGGSSKAWWLRSSMDEARKAGYIRETGYMDADHSSARNFARPAFNLDRSAVLFASAASNSAHNDFAAPAAYSGKEWKLTLKDGNSFAQDASKTSGETELAYGYSDQTLSFSHAALSSFSADYTNVTAALSDENGDVLYYGSINSDGNATSSSLTIPSGLQAGSYTLSIYGEDWNEPNRSDYATGTPFTMTVRVCLPKSTAPATDAPAVAKNRARQQAVSFTLTNAAALRGAH